MRFEYYSEAIADIPKLSVDGTVGNSIHFSHWEGNKTPSEVKADTSTEIALKLVTSPNRAELTQGIELVTNNHFDTDGVLSVWTTLNGERVADFWELLVAAAEAGDFSEYSKPDGVRISLAIQGCDQASPNDETGSPLARFLAGHSIDDDAEAYGLVLPETEKLLLKVDDYESLWRDGWVQIERALESFARGASAVHEYTEAGLTVITLAPDIFSGSGFNPTKHAAPYTAISYYARGKLYEIAIPADGGWFYRLDYPYYSWAETVVRPRIEARDFTSALLLLNEKEANRAGRWQTDNREMTSAVKFVDQQGTLASSSLEPDEVATILTAQTAERTAAGS
jgi:hypothetical protein